ncbi:MAG: hypothetical protein AAGI17_06550 [Planctomycetota bacterium]
MKTTAFQIAATAVLASSAAAQVTPVMAEYNEGDLGTNYLVNEAAVGGADIRSEEFPATIAYQYTGLFNIGDTVSITGVALPLWANRDSSFTTNNTLAGTFTFDIYGLAGGANADAFDGAANETLLGSASLEFDSVGAGVLLFGALFDEAIDFAADSSGFVIYITSDSVFRLKAGPQTAGTGARVNINNGNSVANGQVGNITVLGTAIPAPGAAAAISLAGVFASRRRRTA